MESSCGDCGSGVVWDMAFMRHHYPGLCHLCACPPTPHSPLLQCAQCHLVMYCSKQCQKKDWHSHRPLCTRSKVRNGKNIVEAMIKNAIADTAEPDYQQKLKCREMLSSLRMCISYSMGTRLLPHEEEVFLYPRLCEVCYRGPNMQAKDPSAGCCPRCHCVYYCSERHLKEDLPCHYHWCSRYSLSVECDKWPFDAPVRLPDAVDRVYKPLPIRMNVHLDEMLSQWDATETSQEEIQGENKPRIEISEASRDEDRPSHEEYGTKTTQGENKPSQKGIEATEVSQSEDRSSQGQNEASEASQGGEEASQDKTKPSQKGNDTTEVSQGKDGTTQVNQYKTKPSEANQYKAKSSQESQCTNKPFQASQHEFEPAQLSQDKSQLSQDENKPVGLSQDKTTPAELSQKQNKPVDLSQDKSQLSQDENKPVGLSQNKTKPAELNQNQNKPVGLSQASQDETKPAELSPKTSQECKPVAVSAEPSQGKPDPAVIALVSETLSFPLTALYALQFSLPTLEVKESLALHVLGAETGYEPLEPDVWEYIFHRLPNLVDLDVTLVGPQLKGRSTCERATLCRECEAMGRKLMYRTNRALYHDYVRKKKPALPDLRIAFNCGFHEFAGTASDTWLPTIELALSDTVPLAFTSYTREESLVDLAVVEKIGDVQVVMGRLNPYRSLRPLRNWSREGCEHLYFVNNFVSMVVRGEGGE